MPVEIERKFLVMSDGWRWGAIGQRFCQGYLARADGVTVRVRRAGARAYLTVKGEPNGIVRPEFEYEVPVDEAEAMFKLCSASADREDPLRGLLMPVSSGMSMSLRAQCRSCPGRSGTRSSRTAGRISAVVGPGSHHDPRFRNSRLSHEPQGAGSAGKAA